DFNREGPACRQHGGQLRELAERQADRGMAPRVERHRAERRLAGARELREPLGHLIVERRADVCCHRVYMYFSGSMFTASGSTASTTAQVKSPRPSGSHVFTSSDSSSSAPSLSRTIFTCGRNGSDGCS